MVYWHLARGLDVMIVQARRRVIGKKSVEALLGPSMESADGMLFEEFKFWVLDHPGAGYVRRDALNS